MENGVPFTDNENKRNPYSLQIPTKETPPSPAPVRRTRTGLLLCLPLLPVLLVTVAIPLGLMLYYSFTDFNMLELPGFVGLENYRALFHDDNFWIMLGNTLRLIPLSAMILAAACLLAGAASRLRQGWGIALGLLLGAVSLTMLAPTGLLILFGGDSYNLFNSYLLSNGLADNAVNWLTSSRLLYYLQLSGICLAPAYWIFYLGCRGRQRPSSKTLRLAATLIPLLLLCCTPFTQGVYGYPSPFYAFDTLLSYIYDYHFIRFSIGMSGAACVVFLFLLLLWLGLFHLIVWGITRLLQAAAPRLSLPLPLHGAGTAVGFLLGLVALAPFFVSLATSFKPMEELFRFPASLLPQAPNMQAYRDLYILLDTYQYAVYSLSVGPLPLLLGLVYYFIFVLPAAFGLTAFRSRGLKRTVGTVGAVWCLLTPLSSLWMYLLLVRTRLLPGIHGYNILGIFTAALTNYITGPTLPVVLLLSVWVIKTGAANASGSDSFWKNNTRIFRTLSSLAGVGILSSLALYFQSNFMYIGIHMKSFLDILQSIGLDAAVARAGIASALHVLSVVLGLVIWLSGMVLLLLVSRKPKGKMTSNPE